MDIGGLAMDAGSGLSDWVARLKDRRLVVVGDLVADEYIHGTTSRISREAPVLVVHEERREMRPGGAANAAANALALGGQVSLVGVVGDDPAGGSLLEDLASRGILCEGVMAASDRQTTTKTRVLAGGSNTVRQQMLRIDRVVERPLPDGLLAALRGRLRRALERAEALVVSDYGEGVVAGVVLEEITSFSRAGGAPVLVDSRYRIKAFEGADTLTPNEPELGAATGCALSETGGLERAAQELLRLTACRHLVVKRGRNGMALFRRDLPPLWLPAFGSEEVADVTGAGDTVLAALALARAAGAEAVIAVQLANTAGGIKVTKSGTATVSAEELRRALEKET